MPRRARLSLPGVPLHIIQRGNSQSACFYADEDYALYLHHLKELALRFHCTVHAYVLMTNHVHLLLTPTQEDTSSPAKTQTKCGETSGTDHGFL